MTSLLNSISRDDVTTTVASTTKTTEVNNSISNMTNSSDTNRPNNTSSTNPTDKKKKKAMLYMILLAIQFGIQPILTRRYTSPTIIKSTVVLVQEIIKFIMAFGMLIGSGETSNAIQGWTITTWFSVAVLPAGLYAVQNMASLLAYQNLDPLTYNTLNQTKTLSAALCCYIVMKRRQSRIQMMALLLLLLSAFIMEGIVRIDTMATMIWSWTVSSTTTSSIDSNPKFEWDGRHFTHGVAPILLASFISGLAGAMSQKNLQQQQITTGSSSRSSSGDVGGGRDAYLFTMELCAASCIILLFSLLISSDGARIRTNGFWDGWTVHTLIPIVINSAGGLIVGLVTKYAGSVQKGFALIFGIFLSGIIQALLLQSGNQQKQQRISKEQILGGTIAAISLYLHAANPPTIPSTEKNIKQD